MEHTSEGGEDQADGEERESVLLDKALSLCCQAGTRGKQKASMGRRGEEEKRKHGKGGEER